MAEEWNRKTKIVYTPRRKTQARKTRAVFFLLCGIFLAAGFSYAFFWFFNYEKFQISKVTVEGLMTIPAPDIENLIREYASEKSLGILPRAHYLLFSSREAERRIKNTVLKVREAHAEKQFPDTVRIRIQERFPWGIVCAGVPPKQTGGPAPDEYRESCAYIDENGFAFERAPFLVGTLTKKIFIGQGPITLGAILVPKERVVMYDEFRDMFARISVPITSLVTTKENPRDIELWSGEWYGIVDRDARAADIVTVLRPLLEKELAGKEKSIDYIDLRFGNKIFYKLKK